MNDGEGRLTADAQLVTRHKRGSTPVLYAARTNENSEVIRVLLDAGADVNARTEGGQTPLMYAARGTWNPEVILVLLKAGRNSKPATNSVGRH